MITTKTNYIQKNIKVLIFYFTSFSDFSALSLFIIETILKLHKLTMKIISKIQISNQFEIERLKMRYDQKVFISITNASHSLVLHITKHNLSNKLNFFQVLRKSIFFVAEYNNLLERIIW